MFNTPDNVTSPPPIVTVVEVDFTTTELTQILPDTLKIVIAPEFIADALEAKIPKPVVYAELDAPMLRLADVDKYPDVVGEPPVPIWINGTLVPLKDTP